MECSSQALFDLSVANILRVFTLLTLVLPMFRIHSSFKGLIFMVSFVWLPQKKKGLLVTKCYSRKVLVCVFYNCEVVCVVVVAPLSGKSCFQL